MSLPRPSVSPTISKSPLEGFGPLEALVQAATEERRRLSGDLPTVGWQGTGSETSPRLRAAPASPALVAAPSRSSYSRSPEPLSSPPDHPLESAYGQLSTSPTVSSTRLLPNDNLPEINARTLRDGEPPPKRRKSSNESQPRPPPLAQHSSRSPLVRTRALSPVSVLDMRGRDPTFARPSVWDSPRDPSIISSPRVIGQSTATPVGVRSHSQAGSASRELVEEHRFNGLPYDPRINETRPVPVPVPRRSLKQDDAHEWLLEHYSSSQQSVVAFSPTDHVGSAVSHLSSLKLESHSPIPQVNVRGASRSPSEGGQSLTTFASPVIPAHVSQQAIMDSDIDMELDLAVSSHYSTSRQTVADNDVDDELLSLVDDRPRSSSSSMKPISARSPIPPSGSPRKPTPSQVTSLKNSYLSGVRSPSIGTQADRDSMPPPAVPLDHGGKGAMTNSKSGGRAESAGATQSKKKDSGKAMARTKQIPKAKPKPKGRAKVVKDTTAGTSQTHLSPLVPTTTGRGKKSSPAATPGGKRAVSTVAGTQSRSRSTSVLPPESNKDSPAEAEAEETVDDKLYCVCKTSYDEDRVMIACDRCDEWYHTQCVQMPDDEVDLVDQFICPVCIANNPTLSLKTTYKKRCWAGLKHPNPSSPDACHKPARGAFSKYCSDECGIAYVQSRIEHWGGDKERLWQSVKNADKREAVVVRCIPKAEVPNGDVKVNGKNHHIQSTTQEVVPPGRSKTQRQLDRLNARLDKLAQRRDEIKRDMEIVLWREKLLELAIARADVVNECGWDQRLCFDHEEYAEFGATVFDSYSDEGQKENEDTMQVDGAIEDGEWWCKGKQKCERHAGWQKLRQAEVSFEKGTMEASLASLTAQERELRKHMEEVINPNTSKARIIEQVSVAPLKPLHEPNGTTKVKANGTSTKKGKKRKTEGS
ncbi:unnamed protein product [Somion occarium]|uniref:PHD-type domain-containing protein n=1 Tax=Somion occarium TaxID=3059160 RepID=A0ABP1CJQ7_9APHY